MPLLYMMSLTSVYKPDIHSPPLHHTPAISFTNIEFCTPGVYTIMHSTNSRPRLTTLGHGERSPSAANIRRSIENAQLYHGSHSGGQVYVQTHSPRRVAHSARRGVQRPSSQRGIEKEKDWRPDGSTYLFYLVDMTVQQWHTRRRGRGCSAHRPLSTPST
jgi:hypothetical protein